MGFCRLHRGFRAPGSGREKAPFPPLKEYLHSSVHSVFKMGFLSEISPFPRFRYKSPDFRADFL